MFFQGEIAPAECMHKKTIRQFFLIVHCRVLLACDRCICLFLLPDDSVSADSYCSALLRHLSTS